MTTQQFKIGDTVKLKSGGPIMTIENASDYDSEGTKFYCIWFEKNEKKGVVFHPATLAVA